MTLLINSLDGACSVKWIYCFNIILCWDTYFSHINFWWILCVKESWNALFIVGPHLAFIVLLEWARKTIYSSRIEDDELVWFNLSTQMIHELGIKGQNNCFHILEFTRKAFFRSEELINNFFLNFYPINLWLWLSEFYLVYKCGLLIRHLIIIIVKPIRD